MSDPLGFRGDDEVGFEGGFLEARVLFAFQAVDGLAEELAVEVEADLGDVAGLLGAEEVAGAADLEVAHGDFEAGA